MKFTHSFGKFAHPFLFQVLRFNIFISINHLYWNLAALFLAKLVPIYAFFVCKTFGTKIRSCKIFDKFQVWLQVQFSIKLGFLIIVFAGDWCHSPPSIFESDHPGSLFNQTWIFHNNFCGGIMVPAAPASNSLYIQGGFFYSSTLKMTWCASPIGSSQNSTKNDQKGKGFSTPTPLVIGLGNWDFINILGHQYSYSSWIVASLAPCNFRWVAKDSWSSVNFLTMAITVTVTVTAPLFWKLWISEWSLATTIHIRRKCTTSIASELRLEIWFRRLCNFFPAV